MTTNQTPAPAAITMEDVARVEASKPKRVRTAKPAKAAKSAKPAKAKAVAHKPSTIKPTDDNPAKSIVPVRFKQAYAAHNDTNGSPLSLALKEATTTTNKDGREVLDTKALAAIAKAHGIDFSAYAHLNNGQQRMNVGNKLRGLVKQGKAVKIGGKEFKTPKAVEAKAAAVAA